MRSKLCAAVAIASACLLASPTLAAPFAGNPLAHAADNSLLIQVQHHHHHYHGGGGGDGAGAAAAGAAIGLFLGAVIATEAQRQQAIQYCSQRYRSFDPQSMSYLGRDGLRHPCP